MQGIGMDGIRVFGEYKDWEHNGFFMQVSPLYDTWRWTVQRGSEVSITAVNSRILRRAITLLQERGMIMEYVISATAKALPLIPGYQEHMCRAVSQWFDLVSPGGAHNTMFEIANEYDVTRQEPLAGVTISEIGRRWRIGRPERPDHRADHPNTLLSISEGGEGAGDWDIHYPVETLSHLNVHSPRNHEWEDVGVDINIFQDRYRKPVYLNENIHCMEKAEWDEWIPRIPNWAGLSTRDAKRVIEQATNAFDAGASYCLHFMTGMLTEPDRPVTQVERLWKEAFNPGAPEPPPTLPSGPGDTPDGPGWLRRLLDIISGWF